MQSDHSHPLKTIEFDCEFCGRSQAVPSSQASWVTPCHNCGAECRVPGPQVKLIPREQSPVVVSEPPEQTDGGLNASLIALGLTALSVLIAFTPSTFPRLQGLLWLASMALALWQGLVALNRSLRPARLATLVLVLIGLQALLVGPLLFLRLVFSRGFPG